MPRTNAQVAEVQDPAASDRRPWETIQVPVYDASGFNKIPGEFRDMAVAHANLDEMLRCKPDKRWPRGSFMNPIPPGESVGHPRIDSMTQKSRFKQSRDED